MSTAAAPPARIDMTETSGVLRTDLDGLAPAGATAGRDRTAGGQLLSIINPMAVRSAKRRHRHSYGFVVAGMPLSGTKPLAVERERRRTCHGKHVPRSLSMRS
jgi:hypothetical protein